MSETAAAEERWLSADELAARWGVDPSTIRNQRRLGEGPKGWARFGKSILRILESDVAAYERAQREAFERERRQWAPPSEAGAA